MTLAYLSAGSNLGDRTANLATGIDSLAKHGILIRRVSSVYETEPVGFLDQPWFYNVVLEVDTALRPRDLLFACLETETLHGRTRSFTGAPRTLDLDILIFGELVISEPGLQIPHPRMAARRFVLVPFVEIAPTTIHPVLGKDIRALLSECADPSKVVRTPESLRIPEMP